MMFSNSTPSPWQARSVRRNKKIIRHEIRFAPAFARGAWHKPARSRTARERGEFVSRDQETLLLDHQLDLEGAAGFVRAWLIPSAKPDYYHMRVEMFAPPDVTRNMHVTLIWGKHKYQATLRAGQVFFEDITLPNFSKHNENLPTHRLRLIFDLEGAPTNGSH